ncbi:MAG: cache domain-containing protein, partial [Desulfobacteraceae bacterium]|nr:cache domain-containing protein [Desulfobacteraceae bacterium]
MAPFDAKPRQLGGFAVLAALAAAGNSFGIPLFPGVDFVFGSIAVLIAVRCFGIAAGVIAAGLGAIPTVLLWDHPFAILIFTTEALAVGLVLRWKQLELVVADGLYWLALGIPLAWVIFFGLMDLGPDATLLLSLKLSANGIFNALAASILVHHLPIRRWLGAPELEQPFPLADILFRLILALVLFPTFFLMVINGRASIRSFEKRLDQELDAAASDISYHLATRMQLHLHAVSTLAEMAANFEMTPSRPLQRLTGLMCRTFPDFHNMYVADQNGIAVAFYPPANRKGVSAIGLDFSDRDYFRKLKTTDRPVISDVFKGKGGVEEPIIAVGVPILKEGRFSGFAAGALNLEGILHLLRSYSETKQMEMILLDGKGRIIASTERLPVMSFYAPREGERKRLSKDLFRIMPGNGRAPAFKRWLDSYLVHRSPVEGLPWTLLIQSPLATQEKPLTAIYIRHLALMLLLAALAVAIAGMAGRMFSRSVRQLGAASSDLPGRLLAGGTIDRLPWPPAGTIEMKAVIDNFQAVAATLQQNILEMRAHSQKLARLNTELQEEMAERHRLEETVQRQKRLETIGNLAASVAHDLNNILSGLVGYPDLLLQELPADSALRGRVLRIKDSGERAAAVVQDLLTLARRGVVQKKVLNLNTLVEAYLESPMAKSLQALHPGTAVTRRLAPDLLNVSGSEVHLAKSLMNLVVNAAEALPAGGEIVVSTANRSLDIPVTAFERIEAGDYALLAVSDNGIGIPPQDRKRIFEPFYTKKVMGRSGTGLGMSV